MTHSTHDEELIGQIKQLKAERKHYFDVEGDVDVVLNRCWDEIERLQKEVDALREALTPSEETKAAYMGEFSVPLPEIDESGDEHVRRINVPWTTIKEIMAAIWTRKLATTHAKGEG